ERSVCVYRITEKAMEREDRRRRVARLRKRVIAAGSGESRGVHDGRASTRGSPDAHERRIARSGRAGERASARGGRRCISGGAGEMEACAELLERLAGDGRARAVELVSDRRGHTVVRSDVRLDGTFLAGSEVSSGPNRGRSAGTNRGVGSAELEWLAEEAR